MILPPECSVIYVGKLHWTPAESVKRIRAPTTKLVMANQQSRPPTKKRHGQSESCFWDQCLYYLSLRSLHDQGSTIVQLPVVIVLFCFRRLCLYFIFEEKLWGEAEVKAWTCPFMVVPVMSPFSACNHFLVFPPWPDILTPTFWTLCSLHDKKCSHSGRVGKWGISPSNTSAFPKVSKVRNTKKSLILRKTTDPIALLYFLILMPTFFVLFQQNKYTDQVKLSITKT